ncbi:MAG: hypothetical protein JW876_06480 [Candidatus Krumholzibacteriota bacterium]|nr:hypothetical protein [Candidatus Krumholzibacteriota bacterium]
MSGIAAICLFVSLAAPGWPAPAADAPGLFDPGRAWTWEELDSSLAGAGARKHLAILREDVTLVEARFLLGQLAALDGADALRRLAAYQEEQDARGGSFHGILPPFPVDPDSIPSIGDLDSFVEAALFLAEIRDRNRRAIEKSTGYPLAFRGDSLVIPYLNRAPEGFDLSIDTAAIRALLALFDRGGATADEAGKAARHPVLREMLRHRRDLGYVPPPLPDEEDLARFIFLAASAEPIDMIWKWINPCNLFCMADLALNSRVYGDILGRLERHRAGFSDDVMGRIAQFAPAGIELSETIGFGVNFGVRSWATSTGLGTNVVQFKDDYEALRRTATHEIYHRLQLRLCPVHHSRLGQSPRRFEDLVAWPFPDDRDRKLYEALACVFLEGTATYVGGSGDAPFSPDEARAGGELLALVIDELYARGDPGIDSLLAAGLRSNGPFYALGYQLSEQIAEAGGNGAIGALLDAGAPAFFTACLRDGSAIPGLDGKHEATLREALGRMIAGMR